MTDDSQTPITPPDHGAAPTTDQVKDDLRTAAGSIGAAVEDIRDEAATQADELKRAATAQMSNATEKAKSFAADKKGDAADQLEGVSSAIAKVADELGDNESTAGVAGYARELAGGIGRVSETVRDRSVDDLIGIVQDFGRRQPVAFLGAAALAGFVASRFVIASAERRADRPSEQPYRTYPSAGSGSTPRPMNSGYGSMDGEVADTMNTNSRDGGAFK